MKKEQRAIHLQNWQQSGQSKKAYSESAGIKYQTFLSWFKKKGEQFTGRFRKIGTAKKEDQELRIVFPNGITLHVKEELSAGLLVQLKNV